MKYFVLAIAAVAGFAAFVSSESDVAKEEIRTVIETAYINGAFNDLNTGAMRNGFHSTFRIHGVREGELSSFRSTTGSRPSKGGRANPTSIPRIRSGITRSFSSTLRDLLP